MINSVAHLEEKMSACLLCFLVLILQTLDFLQPTTSPSLLIRGERTLGKAIYFRPFK